MKGHIVTQDTILYSCTFLQYEYTEYVLYILYMGKLKMKLKISLTVLGVYYHKCKNLSLTFTSITDQALLLFLRVNFQTLHLRFFVLFRSVVKIEDYTQSFCSFTLTRTKIRF